MDEDGRYLGAVAVLAVALLLLILACAGLLADGPI